ncbi:MAG: 3,4-dihydroxy-2-butanone-4-phosphate synthase [Planctomycetota bacterium]
MSTSPIPEILEELRAGRMVILVDDPQRENEGDLAMLAEHVTPEAVNFMAREARGLICLPMEGAWCDKLDLAPQVARNRSALGTAFTVSIEAAKGVTTGISAADRAHTIRVACAPDARPQDLVSPGHVFPLRARDGGVLVRGGQTEGIVDLARLAGATTRAGVICEVMNPDGTMARMGELEEFAARHHLKIGTIADIIEYRRRTERLVQPVVMDVPLPTTWGEFQAHVFRSLVNEGEHLALARGLAGPAPEEDPLDPQWPRPASPEVVSVRVHSECLTGDVFGSRRCDCQPQLHTALEVLAKTAGPAVLLYLRQEGRGIGFANKLKAYRLQDRGLDTVEANQALGFPADLREYGIGAQILHFLGVRRMRILTNNPKKIHGLGGYGMEVVEQVPVRIPPNPRNIKYLRTKATKLGHLLEGLEDEPAPSPARE